MVSCELVIWLSTVATRQDGAYAATGRPTGAPLTPRIPRIYLSGTRMRSGNTNAVKGGGYAFGTQRVTLGEGMLFMFSRF